MVFVMLSEEEKKQVIEIWHSTKSLTAVRRSFRKKPGYHAKNLPSISTLQGIVKKFLDHGTVHDCRRGRKSSTQEADVRKVKRLYSNAQLLSLRSASRRLGLSKQKVSTILRLKLLKKAYKAKIRMRLTERQRKGRIVACKKLLKKKRIFPKIWFSDESWFYSDGIAQKRNQYFWTINKDSVQPIESQLEPVKVMVWAAVSSKGLVGPYFFHKNGSHISVNQHTYCDCVAWFIAQLKQNRMLKGSWFMQDGASSHTALKSRTLIKENFPEKSIGKYLDVSWPPYSPDLTPADFWLWPTLKRLVFSGKKEPYTSISALKRAITFGFNKLRRGNFSHLTDAVERRLRDCIERDGFRI